MYIIFTCSRIKDLKRQFVIDDNNDDDDVHENNAANVIYDDDVKEFLSTLTFPSLKILIDYFIVFSTAIVFCNMHNIVTRSRF